MNLYNNSELIKSFALQPGDVPDTWANVDDLIEQFDYNPSTTVEQGGANFAAWFKEYYKA
jgi:UDP-glucuronate 4-epimerase